MANGVRWTKRVSNFIKFVTGSLLCGVRVLLLHLEELHQQRIRSLQKYLTSKWQNCMLVCAFIHPVHMYNQVISLPEIIIIMKLKARAQIFHPSSPKTRITKTPCPCLLTPKLGKSSSHLHHRPRYSRTWYQKFKAIAPTTRLKICTIRLISQTLLSMACAFINVTEPLLNKKWRRFQWQNHGIAFHVVNYN